MPIYEYVCTTCGQEFEVMQKFSDPELKRHDCSPKSKVHKKLSLTSFHLQGGGWYASGYGNGSNGKSAVAPASTGGNGKLAAAPASTGGTGESAPAASKSEGGSESKSPTAVSAVAGGCGAGCACH